MRYFVLGITVAFLGLHSQKVRAVDYNDCKTWKINGPTYTNDEVKCGVYNWLISNRHPFTGLVRSFDVTTDDTMTDQAAIYDLALVSMMFTEMKDYESASLLLDTLDRMWEGEGLPNFVTTFTGTAGVETTIHTGPNAWVAMAAYRQYWHTGERKFLEFAVAIAEWIENGSQGCWDPTYVNATAPAWVTSAENHELKWCIPVMGPSDSISICDEGGTKTWTKIFSTEHVLDAYALFEMLINEPNLDSKTKGRFKKAQEYVASYLKEAYQERPGTDDEIDTNTDSVVKENAELKSQNDKCFRVNAADVAERQELIARKLKSFQYENAELEQELENQKILESTLKASFDQMTEENNFVPPSAISQALRNASDRVAELDERISTICRRIARLEKQRIYMKELDAERINAAPCVRVGGNVDENGIPNVGKEFRASDVYYWWIAAIKEGTLVTDLDYYEFLTTAQDRFAQFDENNQIIGTDYIPQNDLEISSWEGDDWEREPGEVIRRIWNPHGPRCYKLNAEGSLCSRSERTQPVVSVEWTGELILANRIVNNTISNRLSDNPTFEEKAKLKNNKDELEKKYDELILSMDKLAILEGDSSIGKTLAYPYATESSTCVFGDGWLTPEESKDGHLVGAVAGSVWVALARMQQNPFRVPNDTPHASEKRVVGLPEEFFDDINLYNCLGLMEASNEPHQFATAGKTILTESGSFRETSTGNYQLTANQKNVWSVDTMIALGWQCSKVMERFSNSKDSRESEWRRRAIQKTISMAEAVLDSYVYEKKIPMDDSSDESAPMQQPKCSIDEPLPTSAEQTTEINDCSQLCLEKVVQEELGAIDAEWNLSIEENKKFSLNSEGDIVTNSAGQRCAELNAEPAINTDSKKDKKTSYKLCPKKYEKKKLVDVAEERAAHTSDSCGFYNWEQNAVATAFLLKAIAKRTRGESYDTELEELTEHFRYACYWEPRPYRGSPASRHQNKNATLTLVGQPVELSPNGFFVRISDYVVKEFPSWSNKNRKNWFEETKPPRFALYVQGDVHKFFAHNMFYSNQHSNFRITTGNLQLGFKNLLLQNNDYIKLHVPLYVYLRFIDGSGVPVARELIWLNNETAGVGGALRLYFVQKPLWMREMNISLVFEHGWIGYQPANAPVGLDTESVMRFQLWSYLYFPITGKTGFWSEVGASLGGGQMSLWGQPKRTLLASGDVTLGFNFSSIIEPYSIISVRNSFWSNSDADNYARVYLGARIPVFRFKNADGAHSSTLMFDAYWARTIAYRNSVPYIPSYRPADDFRISLDWWFGTDLKLRNR